MKTKYLLSVCLLCCGLAAAFIACNKQASANGYTITGTAEGTQDGDTVYLCDVQGLFAIVPIDSTIVKNGKFEFTGDIEGAVM